MSTQNPRKREQKKLCVRLEFFQLSEGIMAVHLSPRGKRQGLDRILTGPVRDAKQRASMTCIHGQVL